ncbi:MAG TPA: glycoside hydrolase family 1 protein [Candidatus Limnocylindrales bacterium]|nr:glycoside hydrolase family 1 protein [Candidatus Limnocylindrales bacterium]
MPGRFPDGFFFGTATAAHQVEGGNHRNDWWEWEQRTGSIRNGDRSDPACDHFERYQSDFDLLRSLHQNAHRFSVEWSRIEPAEGEFDPSAIAHYRRVLEALHARGLEPMVTLHHFTIPRWLSDRGGWLDPTTVSRFARFTDQVIEALGDLATYWITINEPTGLVYQSYLTGEWPPGLRDFRSGVRVLSHLLLGHWEAFRRIKARRPAAQVGLAHHLRIFDPFRAWHPADRLIAAVYDRVFNETLLRSLRAGRSMFPLSRAGMVRGPRQSQDFIGLNYYTRNLVRFSRRAPAQFFGERVNRAQAPTSDQGLEIYPEGLYRWLLKLDRQRLPIYITENGVADASDALRPAFLRDHLQATLRAMDRGVPVRGYFHWTCFDNFEWAEGYGLKFGLASCDLHTQERRLRPSGRLYAEICRTGSIPG